MPYIKISCHGCYEKKGATFKVPDNTRIFFYCDHGKPSDSSFCRSIESKDLSRGRPNDFASIASHWGVPSDSISEPLVMGDDCYNYLLESFGGGGDAYFNAPKKIRSDMYEVLEDTTLADVVKKHSHMTVMEEPLDVHCLFCRSPKEVDLPKKVSKDIPKRKKRFGVF